MSKKSRTPKMLKILKDVAPLAVGEILVSLAVLLGAILLDLLNVIAFNMFIVSGACLGAVVATLNYVFLVCSVDRAIDQFIARVDIEKAVYITPIGGLLE